MSVYNEESHILKSSIDSILNQTCVNYEFVIVCDNTYDERIKTLLLKYADIDDRIKLHFNDKNIGLTKSLNCGLKQCRGAFIARMDADDVAEPSRLEKQSNYMELHPEIDVLNTYAEMFREKEIVGYKKAPILHKHIIETLQYENVIVHPAVMIRKSFLLEHRIKYNESFRRSQDYCLWLTMGIKGAVFHTLPEVLLHYRISEIQISNMDKKSQFQDFVRIRLNNMEMLCNSLGMPFLSEPTLQYVLNIRKKIDNNYTVFHRTLLFQMMYSVHNSCKKVIHILTTPLKYRWSIKQYMILIFSCATRRWDGYKIQEMLKIADNENTNSVAVK